MLRNIRRFRALAGAERSLLVQAWLALGITAISLRLRVSTLRIERWLQVLQRGRMCAAPLGAHHCARLAAVAARHHPFPTACLARAVCLIHLLRLIGIPGELRFGVRRKGKDLVAHAWVEHDGAPLADSLVETEGFVPLIRGGRDSTRSPFAEPLCRPLRMSIPGR